MSDVTLIEDLDVDLATIAEVYRAAFSTTSLPADDQQVRAFRDETLPRHHARDGFRFAAARDHDRLVGFAYGYTGSSGQYWTDWLCSEIPRELADTWLGGHFEFCELCVQPELHRHGIGGRLHDVLLAGLPHATALLTTQRGDTPARRLYESRGWQELCEVPDSAFVLFGRELHA